MNRPIVEQCVPNLLSGLVSDYCNLRGCMGHTVGKGGAKKLIVFRTLVSNTSHMYVNSHSALHTLSVEDYVQQGH